MLKKYFNTRYLKNKINTLQNQLKNIIKKYLDIETIDNPEIQIDNDLVQKSAVNFNINNDELNVLLGIGGSGPTKRIPSKTFLNVMEKLENFKKM